MRLKQLAHKLTVHVSLQGMSSAGQKRSPPNELERQVSTDQAADEHIRFAASCSWPCAESIVKLKTDSQPWLAGLPFPGRGGQAAESNTVCQHSHIQIALSWITDWEHYWQGNWSCEYSLPDFALMLTSWQHTDRVARSYASCGMRLAPRSRLRIQHRSVKTEL